MPTPDGSTHIFVYGTLKRGGGNHHYISGQMFIGPARTALGYRMFELDGYPGMIADRDWTGSVTGEIWQVDRACLARLDELEGTSEGLYRRVPARLLPPFDAVAIETYLYARPVDGRLALGDTWPI